jgi:molybdopterin/thiamine biosynthesis adenylyltransferase
MTGADSRLRLRPSVALVPQSSGEYQFFQGNTRRTTSFRIQSDLVALLPKMNGERTLEQLAVAAGVSLPRALAFAAHLRSRCLLEAVDVAERIRRSPWRRVLNFLSDFLPDTEVESRFEQVRQTPVMIVGTGAVGSWVANQLVRTGFTRFTLVDDDVVDHSNLNRSLFAAPDVGKRKTTALRASLLRTNPNVEVNEQSVRIVEAVQLHDLMEGLPSHCIVVNCADQPSVDATSALVDEACKRSGMAYVIAGGYNLHLSLIGMTVIPGKTACYHCGCISLGEQQGNDLQDLRKLVRPWRNIGNLAPLAAITASFAASEVLRLAVASDHLPPRMIGRRGEFNFLTNELHMVELPPRRECGCCADRAGEAT